MVTYAVKKLILLPVALIISGLLEAQDHNLTILRSLNSPEIEICLAMMPDSTMLVSSYRSGKPQCYALKQKDTTWVAIHSPLADMINSLMPTSASEPYFRFSPDYTHIVVTIQEDGPNRFYESVLINGEWSFFNKIELNPELVIWHGLGMSADHTKLFGRARDGGLYQFDRIGESWSPGKRLTVFDQVTPGKEVVEDVMTIGENGLVARVDFESTKSDLKAFQKKYRTNGSKLSAYFFTRLQPNGKWTAPIVIPDVHPLVDNLVITPNGDWALFSAGIDFGKMPAPKLLQAEMAAGKNNSGKERELKVTANAEQAPVRTRMETGKYYALLIGNADYRIDKLDLTKPPQDVNALSEILQSYYQFEKENILQLINADRNAIFSALQELRKKITSRDNVLIFYAGHGSWDDAVKQGYWWPVDASPDNAANWLSNSDLREQISGINSAHTLLITDACFSGAIFKTRGVEELRTASFDIQQLYRLRSRRAITSGTMQVVPDESPFIKYLVQFLKDNPDKFLSSGELFTRMRRSVMNNGITVPQDGVIMNTGDEGGDFIFIRKD